jgi:hypothetical protein
VRRLFWVGVGVAAAVMTARWVRKQRARYGPSNMVDRLSEGGRDLGRLVALSVVAGREAMAQKEAEIRASLEKPVPGGPGRP